MDKKVSRSSFKHNFLKNIIMRVDFQGVMQPEMENIIVTLKPVMKEYGFNRYEEKIGNEIELNINPENNDSFDSVKEVRQTKIYAFSNDDIGLSVDMSTSFAILKVNARKYVDFQFYSEIFIKICNVYHKNIDYFTTKRFGLRKINFCFIKDDDLSDLKYYFKEKYYDLYDAMEGSHIIANDKKSNVAIDLYKLNIRHSIEQGKLEEDIVYKITLDSDIYTDNTDKIEELLFEKKELSQMNDILFGVYIESLTDEFINILSEESEEIDIKLLGVDFNE